MEEIKLKPYDILGQRPGDYIFGSSEKITKTEIFNGSKISYLPIPERQSSRIFDSYSCVSYAFLNTVEINFKRLIELGKISKDNLDWLKDNGYFINGEINLSDRFLSVMSNTTPEVGNSGAVVAQTARDFGLAPQALCEWNETTTQAEYYDRSTITDKAKEVALEFKKRFNIQYEWVRETEWDEASKYGTLEFFTYAWFQQGVKYYNPNPGKSNHAVCEADLPNLKIFDTYQPFIKTMTKREDFLDFALCIYLSEKNTIMTNVKVVKDTNSKTIYMALPVSDETSFESYCQNYGISVLKNSDGSINWNSMINGSINIA